MAYNFPNSPSNGDTVTVNNVTYTYNSTSGAWKTTATSGSGGGGGGASVTVSETAPTSPTEGDLWFDPSVLKTFVYYNDGTANQWVQSNPTGSGGGASGGASVAVSETAPTSPSAGDLWWSSSEAVMYIYYTDTDSSQWVSTSTPGADGAAGASASVAYANFAAFPATPTEGDIAYAQDTNALYVYNGTSWSRIDNGDESPIILTEPPTTEQALNSDGTTSTVTMTAQDPEGFDITYGIAYKTTGNTLPSQLASATTINQNTGVYTFTPTTTQANAGTFTARLSASDGAKTTTRLVNFSLNFAFDVEYLLVAGGGAGGNGGSGGGGGGAGGLLTATRSVSPGDTLNVTVGSGGAAWSTAYSTTGNAGGNSTIVHGATTLTAYGGGFGSSAGPSPYNSPGGNGGSGGGGAQRSTSPGGVGVYPGSSYIDEPRQGYDGGVGGTGTDHGGGGGGAGGAGANSSGSSNGGAGGIGIESSITGTATYYAGGGGGAGNGNGALGGSSIGGTGAGSSPGTGNANGTAGAANTGSGGGGANFGGTAGAGADGIVILRTTKTATSTTGSPTVTTDGSYNIYSFTADGSITF